MSRRGYDEYRDLSAVIFTQVRSSESELALSMVMPWLDARDDVASNHQQKNQHDERRIELVDLALKKMLKDNIICEVPSTEPKALEENKRGRRFEISSRCDIRDRQSLETYTIRSEQKVRYDWMTKVFKDRALTAAMLSTLTELEQYLAEEALGSTAPPLLTVEGAAARGDSAAHIPPAKIPVHTVPLERNIPAPDDHAKAVESAGNKHPRVSSVGSGTTRGSSSPAPLLNTPRMDTVPRHPLINANGTSSNHSEQRISVNYAQGGLYPSELVNTAVENAIHSARLPLQSVVSTKSTVNQPALYAASQKSIPVSSDSAGLAESNDRRPGKMPSDPSMQDLISPVEEDPSYSIPPVPQFIVQGLARFRERFPDDEFESIFEKDIWLITCHDCKGAIYKPGYNLRPPNLNNFETHLKNYQHTLNLTAKLSALGKKPTLTPDVLQRTAKFEYHPLLSVPVDTPERPTFPTERQFSAMSAKSYASPRPSAGDKLAPSVASLSQRDSSPTQIMATLGQGPGFNKDVRTKSESQEDRHRSKRLRLSPDDGVLEKVLKKNQELNARVESLELLNKTLVENTRKRKDEINKQFQTLGAADLTIAKNDSGSRKRIDALEQTAQDIWAIYNKHDKDIDVLKKSTSALVRAPAEHGKSLDGLVKSFSTISSASPENSKELEYLAKSVPVIARASHEHDIQIERVALKAAEMEQTLKQLQELCSAQNERLEAASKVENELRDRIMTVQKLALRQAESMKDVSKAREENEKRFALLEDVMASQSSRKNEWNQAFKTVIDRNSDAILHCQGEAEHILERVEALERVTVEQNITIAKIEGQASPDELDVMPKYQTTNPRKPGPKPGRRSN